MFKQTQPTDRSRSIVTGHRPSRKRRRQARLTFEQLERRNLLATYIVDTASDNDPTGIEEGSGNTGDLRYAIRMAAVSRSMAAERPVDALADEIVDRLSSAVS